MSGGVGRLGETPATLAAPAAPAAPTENRTIPDPDCLPLLLTSASREYFVMQNTSAKQW